MKQSITQKMLSKARYLLFICIFLLSALNGFADHFRYGNSTWERVPGNPLQIKFTIRNAFRTSALVGLPAPLTVGSTLTTGNFNPGQGSNQQITYTITAINAKDDWYFGEFTFIKTYTAPGVYTASFNNCCRIVPLQNNSNGLVTVPVYVQVGTSNNSNDAPVVVAAPIVNFPREKALVSLKIPAVDPNGDALTFSLTPDGQFGTPSTHPAGMSVTNDGWLTWNTIGKTKGQFFNASVRVTDAKGAFTTVDFLIKVVDTSEKPSFDYVSSPADGTTFNLQPGQPITFSIKVSDPATGDTISLYAVGLPPGATFTTSGVNPVNGTFGWTPTPSQQGTYVVTFISQDTTGVQNSTTINFNVAYDPYFDVPTTPGNNSVFSVKPGDTISQTITAKHPNATPIKLTAESGIVAGMAFSPSLPISAAHPATTNFTWIPQLSNWGVNRVVYKAEDTFRHKTAFDTIYYVVDNPPTITSTPVTSVNAGQPYSYVLTATDLDLAVGDKLKVENINLPSFLSIVNNNNNTWTISGTPGIGDVGLHGITIEVADSMNHVLGTHDGNAFQYIPLNVLNAPLSVTGTVSNVTIFGNSNGSINITPTGGVGPYTYSWSNSTTSEDQSGLVAGTYTVVVTDANSTTATATFTITQPAQLTVTGVVTDVTIFGGSNGAVNITSAGGVGSYTYVWSNSTTSEDPSGLTAASYTVTVTDANGATATGNFTVNQPAQLTATGTISPVLINGGNTGSIDVTPAGGVGPYAYLWSNNATTEDLSGIPAGTYTVTITDANGATFTATYTVTQPAALTVSGVVSDVTIFNSNNGAINITPAGGVGPYTYVWNNNSTNEDRTGLTAGTYSVTVTDANGATATGSYTVTQPTQLTVSGVVSNVTIFNGNNGSINITAAGGVGPYSYAWSNSTTSEDPNGLTAGTYSVTVTDANGATATGTYTVSQPAQLTATGIVTPVAINNTNTGSIDVTPAGGVGPYTYLWSNNATTEDLSGIPAGSYTVTITDANGATFTATYTVTQPAALTVSGVVSNVTIFNGNNGSIDITPAGGVGPYTYVWNNNSTNEDRTGLTAGTYSVTVTDANGATATGSYTVTQPTQLTVSGVVSNVTIFNGNNGAINITAAGGVGPYTYVWNNNSTNEDRTGLTAGTYNVTVTDANGATATGSYTVTQPNGAPLVATLAVSPVYTVTNHAPYTIYKGYGAQSVTLTATATGGTPGYTYSWSPTTGVSSPNSASTLVSPQVTTTYTVTVKDANNVTVTLSKTINVINVKCNSNGNNTKVYVCHRTLDCNSNHTHNSNCYDYHNICVDDNSVPTHLAHGDYIGECMDVYAAITNVTCNGNGNGAINLTMTGGVPPFTYSWSNNATTQDLTGLSAGTYTVTITGADNRTLVKTYAVTQPSAINLTAAITNVQCYGEDDGAINLSVSGGTSPYTYKWNNNLTCQDRTGLVAGTYSVIVTDNKGCTKTGSYTITAPTSGITVTGVVTHASCNNSNNGSINVSVSGGSSPYSYNWSNSNNWCSNNNNITTQDRSNLDAGSYSVKVTDAKGCTKTMTFTVTEPTSISGSISGSSLIYKGYGSQSVTLTTSASGGNGGYTYQWTPSGTVSNATAASTSVSPSSTTTYSCKITDSKGCMKTITKTITVDDVRCGSNNDKVVMCRNNKQVCVSQSQVQSYLNNGYSVGECYSGCKTTEPSGEETGIEAVISEEIKVYPNPTNGIFLLELPAGVTNADVLITDMTGKMIEHRTAMGVNSIRFDLSNVAAGTYMINVASGKNIYQSKITIQ